MKVIYAKKKDEEGFWLILCPKEEKEIPDYNCVGSFVRGKPTCSHLQSGAIGAYEAQMQCLYPEEREEE